MAKGGAGKGTRKHHKGERSSRPGPTIAADKGRAARRNQATQQRKHRRMQSLEQHRATSGLSNAPKVVTIVAAGDGCDSNALARILLARSSEPLAGIADVMTADNDSTPAGTGAGVVLLEKQRQRFSLLKPARTVQAVLEAAKVADVLLLLIPADGLDAFGEQLVDAICMQGVGTVVGVLQGNRALPPKQQATGRKRWAASLEARFPDNARLFSDDVDPDGSQLIRHLCALTPRQVSWRKNYSYLLSHSHTYTPDEAGDRTAEGIAAEGTLEVCGFVRSLPLSVDRLVHVPGVGDVQPSKLEILPDPHSLTRASCVEGVQSSMSVDDERGRNGGEEVFVPTKKADTNYEAEADELRNEQTWPTELEEMEAAAAARRGKKKKAGSGEEYAEGWTGALEAEESEDEDGEEAAMLDGEGSAMDEGTVMGADELVEMSEEEEKEARRRFMLERSQREDDAKFPDEVDTPIDQLASTRFARYRGLKSFRSSPWHPLENLPSEYGRIYQFEDWPALQKQSALQQAEEEAVAPPGSYVRVTLRVPAAFARLYGTSGDIVGEVGAPLILSGVNEHENRLSVVHFTVSLTAAAEAADVTVRGKLPLVFHCGFRRFVCQPIYSEDTRRADKHRLERYLQPGRPSVASIYAPALYAPSPMLAFLPQGSELGTQHPHLTQLPIASGALLSVDPNRIILKKVLLTGHPFRCHKKKAVVRWMFFSPEDIRWFRPIELHTKFGRKGNIRESLGTHGYMKCIFDGAIHQHDTVCMSLYKRAFPKWRPFSYLDDGSTA